MKLKNCQGFPEKKKDLTEDTITGEQGIGYNQALSELGELDLTEAFEKWAKENGWVNISAKGQEIIDKKLATNGYIKLSEVSLDVGKIHKILMDNICLMRAAKQIANSKEVVKLKEK